MTLEKCMQSGEEKKKCEFKEFRTRGVEKVSVCTGSGYCPFREDVFVMIQRKETPKKTKGGEKK